MDKRRKYILVVDVETAGGLDNPLVYDLGFAIVDKTGKVYEAHSYAISEIFDNKKLMSTAYYKEKVPKYLEKIANGEMVKMPFLEARQQLLDLMEKYDCNTFAAYNLAFDRNALGNTIKNLYGKNARFLTPKQKGMEQLCIWSFACEVIYTQPSFRKAVERNGWFTPAGNMRTSAEIGWRYITNDTDFEEEHTGLADVRIEAEILAKCYSQHKKHESGMIGNPWRIPNKC